MGVQAALCMQLSLHALSTAASCIVLSPTFLPGCRKGVCVCECHDITCKQLPHAWMSGEAP